MLFRKKTITPEELPDPENWLPVVRCSICTGEQVAGFQNRSTGQIKEIMLIKEATDLMTFCKTYNISKSQIQKVY